MFFVAVWMLGWKGCLQSMGLRGQDREYILTKLDGPNGVRMLVEIPSLRFSILYNPNDPYRGRVSATRNRKFELTPPPGFPLNFSPNDIGMNIEITGIDGKSVIFDGNDIPPFGVTNEVNYFDDLEE